MSSLKKERQKKVCVPSQQHPTIEREKYWFSFLRSSLSLSRIFSIILIIFSFCLYLHTNYSKNTKHIYIYYSIFKYYRLRNQSNVYVISFLLIRFLDWFRRKYSRMGNFLWDDEYNDVCFTQHYNGRPLSVVLTEPFDPFEPQPTSFFDDIPYAESDFASLHQHHHHHHQRQRRHRSRSSGRRYKREYFSMLNKSKPSLNSLFVLFNN